MHIGQRAGDDAGGKRRCIELVFSVENQCRIETLAMHLAWRFVVQHVQKMPCDRIVVRFYINARAVRVKPVPVNQHRRQTGEQSIGDIGLVREIAFGLNVAKKRNGCAQHVHRMRIARYHFQHRFERSGQTTQGLQPRDVGIQFGARRQLAVQQQIRHFFETGFVGKIVDVIAAIGQSRAFLAHRTQSGFAGRDARESTHFFLCCHSCLPIMPCSWCQSLSLVSPCSTNN